MASAGKEEQVSATPTVDAGQARALLSSGGHAYLDVRLPEDFENDHAAGAVNVSYYLAVTPQGKEKNPKFVEEVGALYGKEQHLVVGCRTGVRSKLATADLVNAGYENARSLQGGYLAFLQSAAADQQPAAEQEFTRRPPAPWSSVVPSIVSPNALRWRHTGHSSSCFLDSIGEKLDPRQRDPGLPADVAIAGHQIPEEDEDEGYVTPTRPAPAARPRSGGGRNPKGSRRRSTTPTSKTSSITSNTGAACRNKEPIGPSGAVILFLRPTSASPRAMPAPWLCSCCYIEGPGPDPAVASKVLVLILLLLMLLRTE
ncbi:thiosulfate sulfurtransferase 16, chloroplastic-like [Hordeum vulgare]|nr:thiosulfate sulfurtransferase 16, chloroplastic-like [Hordeum vulgare]